MDTTGITENTEKTEITETTEITVITEREIVAALCRELTALARREEEAAANEAARTPYWVACPPSVLAHRATARALRADAERLQLRDERLLEAS